MKGIGIALAAGMLSACGAASAGSSATDTPTDTAAVAPATFAPSTDMPTAVATVPPAPVGITACYVAPSDGKDTRVSITGVDAATTCPQVQATLGASTWTVLADNAPVPSDDVKTLCQGTVGQSTWRVLDHRFVNFTGLAACDTLQHAY